MPSAFTIVPRFVLGGPGYTPPSETLTKAVIGVGGRADDWQTGGAFQLRQPGWLRSKLLSRANRDICDDADERGCYRQRCDADGPMTRFLALQLGTSHWFNTSPVCISKTPME